VRESLHACVCVCERESVCVRESRIDHLAAATAATCIVSLCVWCVCVCVCVHVLQCVAGVAVCCSVLQGVSACCSSVQCE